MILTSFALGPEIVAAMVRENAAIALGVIVLYLRINRLEERIDTIEMKRERERAEEMRKIEKTGGD